VPFAARKTVLGTVELRGGKAKFTTTTLAAGGASGTATYNGDSNIAIEFGGGHADCATVEWSGTKRTSGTNK